MTSRRLRVLVCGASGRMGQVICPAIASAPDLELVARCDRATPLDDALRTSGAEIGVDFTTPASGAANARAMIARGVCPVVGTTGLTPEQVADLAALSAAHRCGGVVAANFALGAAVLARMCEIAVRQFADVEILEMHHAGKRDAPSGTALELAQRLAALRGPRPQGQDGEPRLPSRGQLVDGVPVHAVRLPGLVAHQEVWFGSSGQTISVRHDVSDRAAYVPGLLLAIRHVRSLSGLVVGLPALLAHIDAGVDPR